MPENESGQNI